MRILSVSEFLSLVNDTLRALSETETFAVEGEVSGYRVSQGQWVSFDLKDGQSLVNVFLPVWKQKVALEDGMKVRVIGLPRVYPKYGKFSLSAETIELAGEGALRKALALLRQRLALEGLFDPLRKRALPRFPRRIALVASRDSAAYGDFIRILGERWGGLKVDLYHVLVQGARAAADVMLAIREAEEHDYDVLVLTRGGGSFEELMPFNDEQLARVIHGCRIPTLIAIGHERDLTLAEEAADVRGSTPTDCARRLVPDRHDVAYELANWLERIETTFVKRLEQGQRLIEHAILIPGLWLAGRRAELEVRSGALVASASQWLIGLRDVLTANIRLLSSLDPQRVLSRGYAILRDRQGRPVSSVAKLSVGDEAAVVLKDGEAGVRVTRVGL